MLPLVPTNPWFARRREEVAMGKRSCKKVGRLAAVTLKSGLVSSLAAAAVVVVTAPSSLASGGTSPTTNGCYSTWGNTGSDAHCTNPHVTVTGNYRNHLSCNSQVDKVSGWIYFQAGAYADHWGQLNCTFKASSSRVEYTG